MPKAVIEMVGHEDAAVTMNIYTHVGNAEKNEAIERLDALLG